MLAARGALNFKIPIHGEASGKFYRRWNLRLNFKILICAEAKDQFLPLAFKF